MMQIVDINWKFEEKNKTYSQVLKIYDLIEKVIKPIQLDSKNPFIFDFKLSEKRYCSGYYEFGEFHFCPFGNELTKASYDQCYHCQSKEGFKSAFLMRGETNENMQQYLSQKHFIYLAYFSPGRIKVGTASEKRMRVRPIEQDALVYTFIAESDGFNIQDLEKAISKNFQNIYETVNSSFKFNHITQRPRFETAKKELSTSFQKIKDRFKDSEFKNWIFENIEVIDLTDKMFFPIFSPDLIKYEVNFKGNFLGLRGRFILVELEGREVAYDKQELIGRRIK